MGDAAAGDGAALTGRLRANSIPTSPRVLLTTEGPPDASLVTRERSSSQRSHLGDESSEGEMGTAARSGGRTARDPLMARFQQRLQASSSMEELPAAPAPSRLQAADAAERIQLEDASAEDAIRQISSKVRLPLSLSHFAPSRARAAAAQPEHHAQAARSTQGQSKRR